MHKNRLSSDSRSRKCNSSSPWKFCIPIRAIQLSMALNFSARNHRIENRANFPFPFLGPFSKFHLPLLASLIKQREFVPRVCCTPWSLCTERFLKNRWLVLESVVERELLIVTCCSIVRKVFVVCRNLGLLYIISVLGNVYAQRETSNNRDSSRTKAKYTEKTIEDIDRNNFNPILKHKPFASWSMRKSSSSNFN